MSASSEPWWNGVQTDATVYTSLNSHNRKSGMLRSSSTGNLPSSVNHNNPNGLSMTKTISHSNLHNDRLIDGPLPLLGPNGLVETYRRQFSGKKPLNDVNYSNSERKSDSSSGFPQETTGSNFHTSNNNANANNNGHSIGDAYRPLCFTIAGGAPNGRVSWAARTILVKTYSTETLSTVMQVDWRSIS
jgi:hypothetical protein